VCQELQQLEKCEQFKKMSPEEWVIKVNELRLFLICMRYTSDKDCYQKAKSEYKGGSESGCGMDHHPLLHWALIVARLFQVQVALGVLPGWYPAVSAAAAGANEPGGGRPCV
jgi:hypothetical protein